MAFDECRQMKMEKLLITCCDDNVGSARTIEKCGGVFEKLITIEENGTNILKRQYWIVL